MPTFGYLPYQGWVFLFIFLTLKHLPEKSWYIPFLLLSLQRSPGKALSQIIRCW